MSNQAPSGTNLQKLVGTATAVVGGIALMTKLGIDEIQHRQMKQKTDPSNAYSSIRILPDLVRFQGYIRIYRHRGKIVCPVPRKIEDVKSAQKELTDDTNNEADVETVIQTPAGDNNTSNVIHDVDEIANQQMLDDSDLNDNNDNNDHNHNKQEDDVDIKWLSGSDPNESQPKDSGWFQSFSSFASNAKKSLQTMYEEKTVDFNSDFAFSLRDSAIHKNDMQSYVLTNNRFLDLFEPLPEIQTADQYHKQKSQSSLPLYEQWEFCAVKIHHETLFIRYANKWITLPLSQIHIAPFTLKDADCTAFIVDYQKYFTIAEEKGFVLICQHLDDPCIEFKEDDIESGAIEIPDEHRLCPWPYIQQYVIGYHDTSYVSLRKKQVLKCIVEKVSNAMKDGGFDNHTSYKHAIQFRKCIDSIVSNLEGAEKALIYKQKQQKDQDTDDNWSADDDDDDDDVDMSSKQEINEMKEVDDNQEEDKSEIIAPQKEKQAFLPYLNLLNDPYHGLNVHDISEIDWKLAAEASWLSNYVYDIHKPISPQNNMPRRNSWTHFRSYMSMGSSTSNLKDIIADHNINEEEDEIEYRGPKQFESDSLWKKHSDKHYKNLSKFGFELLDYAITQKGQSVQYMITRSYDNPSTIFLTFKGTSNPLDAMVNIGLHPLYLDYFQCSVFSGMFAALQQSLAFICRKLNIYSSDEYFENHLCPPQGYNVTKIYKLVICGHSLGGGYAQLFLAHLLSASEFRHYFETIKCVTFGSPLIFCKDVRSSFFYDKLNEKCLNFVYQFDLVPRLQNGMDKEYRCKLLQGLLMSQLPVSNIGMVFDINERMNYVMRKFEEHQWLLDRYCYVGKYVVLFEKDEPKSIDKKQKCFTKSATSHHLSLDANTVLRMSSILPQNEPIFADQVLNDHKMLNYMKTIMFQQF